MSFRQVLHAVKVTLSATLPPFGRHENPGIILTYVQGVVEGPLSGRHEIELLQAEEVRHGRHIVRENVLTEPDDSADWKKSARESRVSWTYFAGVALVRASVGRIHLAAPRHRPTVCARQPSFSKHHRKKTLHTAKCGDICSAAFVSLTSLYILAREVWVETMTLAADSRHFRAT